MKCDKNVVFLDDKRRGDGEERRRGFYESKMTARR